MWMRELAGYDYYHLIAGFFLFSVLGWLVESIYMSFCNHRLTNRGFMAGPFCPIYGVGAVVGYLILHPFSQNLIALYLVGAVLATVFEYLVAQLMLRLFGEVWWDYNEKPYNYKGVVCLESTLAWGLYAVIIITFLFDRIMSFIDRYPMSIGLRIIFITFFIVMIDFGYHFLKAIQMTGQFQKMKENHESIEKLVNIYNRFQRK